MNRRPRPYLVAAALVLAGCAAVTAPPPSSTPAAPQAPVAAPGATVTAGGPERVANVPGNRAPQPALAPRYQAILVPDHCVDRDILAPAATEAHLTLLDRTYGLAASYEPADLVPAAEAGFDGSSAEKLVRALLIDDLAAMRRAWEAADLTIVVDSAYRSWASQAATFNSWVARLGYAGGLLRSARPGHSEHHLGTAIDVISPEWVGRVGDWAAESAAGAWMAEHAWEYGFVMSYPAGATADTCFGYEPWHYRWVGREVAEEHRRSGLTLRRYLERHATG